MDIAIDVGEFRNYIKDMLVLVELKENAKKKK